MVQANAGQEEDVKRLFKETMDAFGEVNVVVNNAGITRDGLMMRMKMQQWQEVIDTNLTGVFMMCQEGTKMMGKKKPVKGRIVNIASVVGVTGNAGQANYSAAKAGVIGLTKTIAREYSGRNIVCNAIARRLHRERRDRRAWSRDREEDPHHHPPEQAGQPARRWPAGPAPLALDLAAAYITGQTICIDGGMVMPSRERALPRASCSSEKRKEEKRERVGTNERDRSRFRTREDVVHYKAPSSLLFPVPRVSRLSL